MAKRYFLDTDGSGHWYLVDAAERATWEAWCNLPEDDERTWEAPSCATRLGGSPHVVEFADPTERGIPLTAQATDTTTPGTAKEAP